MAKNIEPGLRKIGEYLKLDNDSVFVIPEYQRAYSWRIDECDKLWQDLVEYIESDIKDAYFFGTIIVSCEDGDTKYSLIDGQQRTTTFLLLLKALLIRINVVLDNIIIDDDSMHLYLGLKARRKQIMKILYKVEDEYISDKPDKVFDSKIYSQVNILKNESINEEYREELTKILNSYDFDAAETVVEKIKYKQKDNRYTNFFRNFKFFYGKVCELNDSNLNIVAKSIVENCEVIEIKSWKVEQAIKMFNSLNSSGLPLYDSDIISAQLYAEAKSAGKHKEFSEKWMTLKEISGRLESMGVSDLNSLLAQYMYYVRTVGGETTTDSGSINVTTPGVRRYFTELNTAHIKNPILMCSNLVRLASFWEAAYQNPLLQIALKFNDNVKLFLASYFLRFENSVPEKELNIILESMLRLFAVLAVVDYGYSSKYFKTFLFSEEIKMSDANISVDEIRKDFDKHINTSWDKENIKALIREFDGNVMVYLNEYLAAKEHGFIFNLGLKHDIEHIMPYSGKNKEEIRKDAGINTVEEFNNVVNKIGNKILLEEKINRSIGNEWFRSKVSSAIGDKTGYIDSKYPTAKILVIQHKNQNKPYWTKEDIERATDEIANRIVNFIFDVK